jgi:hypothetical protein
MIDSIQRILHKLAYLRHHEDFDEIDTTWERRSQLRQSRHHRYQLPPPLTETELADFEARNNFHLPADYRLFLLDVSAGGAGPGDMVDLRTLLALEAELRQPENEFDERWLFSGMWFGDLNKPFPLTLPTNDVTQEPFFVTVMQSEGEEEARGQLYDGMLFLADLGCWCRDLLVVCGAARGQVWTLDGDDWHPVRHQASKLLYHVDDPAYRAVDAKPVTFAVWYEAWLDENIATAYAHWQKRGRIVPVYEERA